METSDIYIRTLEGFNLFHLSVEAGDSKSFISTLDRMARSVIGWT